MAHQVFRFLDAWSAVQAAVEEGIVPGGGVALLYASKILDGSKGGLNFDQKIGVDIVERALRVPLKTIANNAGAPSLPLLVGNLF